MRFQKLCRLGSWPTCVGVLVYFAMSFILCALFGGAALDVPMPGVEIGLLLSAPLLLGAMLPGLLSFVNRNPHRPTSGATEAIEGGLVRPADARWVCLLHALTFGGMAVLTAYLTLFFHQRHGVGPVLAATATTLIAAACFALRPLGSYLAGRFGETQLLLIVFIGAGVLLLDLAASPPLLWATILPLLVLALLALGNGVVLQYLPQRLSGQAFDPVNLVAGITGGLAGCLLLTALGSMRFLTGGFSLALVLLAFVAFSGSVARINLVGKLPGATGAEALERT